MDTVYLFCGTVNDIKNVIENPNNYEIVRASALLRQLLVDGNRLIDVVNRQAQIKIQYQIADSWETPYTKMVIEDGALFLAVLDGLSPDKMLIKAPIKKITRDQFLAHNVVFTNGKYITIRDIIDHCANVMGGVHFGAPRSESQRELSNLQSIIVGGASINVRQLLPILRVVHKALMPLSESLCS